MKTYNVISSNGELTLDVFGKVIDVSLYVGGNDYLVYIVKVDFGEYIGTYGSLPDCGEFDILDLGYWSIDGSYDPPCQAHRDNIKLVKSQDE
jgi:hypothetical protein